MDALAATGTQGSSSPTGLSNPAKIVSRGRRAFRTIGTAATAQATIIAVLHRRERNRPSGKIHPTTPKPTIRGIQTHSCSHAA